MTVSAPTIKDVFTLGAGLVLFATARFVVNYIRHPLRKFPGPFLAGATFWYRAYYDIWRDGEFLFHLKDLHEKYGPIVRITPDELHFCEASAYPDMYNIGSKFTKDPTLYRAAGRDDSSFGYHDAQKARVRRGILSPMFSRRAVLNCESLIQEKIDRMINNAIALQQRAPSVNMFRALRCVSLDIISKYCFGQSFDTLAVTDFSHPMVGFIKNSIRGTWVFRHFPIIRHVIPYLPTSWVLWLLPYMKGGSSMRQSISVPLDVLLNDKENPGFATTETVYHQLLTPQPAKGHHNVPSRTSCLDEGMTLIGAGGENTGSVSGLGVFFTISDRDLYARVQAELRAVWPDLDGPPLGLEKLEKLPLLTGVVKESLRLANCAATPLPRNVGPEQVTIGGHIIPANTIVSLGHSFIHSNPEIFKNPGSFDPDRWTKPNSKELDQYLVSFSRGPRQCLGMTLAWAELYMMIGNTLRRMDMEVYNTSMEDFAFRQYFIPYFSGREFNAICRPAKA